MDSDLLSALDNLNFTAEEAEAVVSDSSPEDEDSGSWLVGSVVSSKPIDGDSVIRVFQSVWKSKNVQEIVELRSNFFLIKPSTVDARSMIFKRRPWMYHEQFFSIKPYNPILTIEDYDFQLMTIWIRVYRLPLRAMNREMGLRLGSSVGKALGVDHRIEGGNMGEFLRILVQVDIRKPLRRCVLLGGTPGKSSTPCPLRYERLPEFCFFCGLVGHALAACTSKPTDLGNVQLQYGSWLRVQTQQPRPGPRRRTGIEYFSDTAPRSTESSSTNAPAADTPAPTATPATPAPPSSGKNSMDAALGEDTPTGADTAQVPKGTKATTADIAPAATEFSASFEADSATVLRHAENDPSSQVKDTKFPAPCKADSAPIMKTGEDGTSSQVKEVVPPSPVVVLIDETVVPGRADPTVPVNTVEDHVAARLSTAAVRSSKRAIQGRYEVCHPIQAKRPRLPTDSGSTKTGMSSIISPTEVAERLRNSSTSRIKASLGMDNCFTVDFGNGCNGLMLLWNNAINVNLLSYSATHIDATVDSPTGSFHFTGFHGYYTESMKHLNWSLFDRLRQASSLPWLIGGDFNELLCHSEKEGGRRKARGLVENSRECLHQNNLFDCNPSSGWFTFTYSNGSFRTIRERLDRFVASPDWLSRHPFFRASSSFTAKSDHCILLMDSDPVVDNGSSRRGGDYFRYDNCWATESACIDKVHTVWSFTAGSAIDKLSAVGGALRTW
ncbi:hypothetical protein GQ457_12G013510 [Hibiscus cannabinus]